MTTVIPGARNATQATRNAAAARTDLPVGFDAAVHEVYDRRLRESIQARW